MKDVEIAIVETKFLDRKGEKNADGKLPQYKAYQARLVSGRAYTNLSHARIDMLGVLGVSQDKLDPMHVAVDEAEAMTVEVSPQAVKEAKRTGPVKVFTTFAAADAARTAARAK